MASDIKKTRFLIIFLLLFCFTLQQKDNCNQPRDAISIIVTRIIAQATTEKKRAGKFNVFR